MVVDNLMQWFESWTLWEAGSPLLFLIVVVIAGVPIFLLMAVNALVAVYAELKISAFMQDRVGPMGQGPGLHAGKWGLLQTVADALKLLLKEDIIPTLADRKLFIIAPFIIFVTPFIALAALPFNQNLLIADLSIVKLGRDAAQHIGKDEVRQRRDDHRDQIDALAGQPAGNLVGHVSQRLRGGQHLFARRGGNVAAIAQHPADRHLRDPRCLGHVAQGQGASWAKGRHGGAVPGDRDDREC